MKITLNKINFQTRQTSPLKPEKKLPGYTNAPQDIKNYKPQNFQALQGFYYPINFTSSKRVQRKNVPIAASDGSVRCPCCGEKMVAFDQGKGRKLAIAISLKRGEDLSNILKENMKEFQSNKRALVREIARLAPKYPDKKLPALLDILSAKYIDTLRIKQVTIAMKLTQELPELSPKKKAKIREWQLDQIDRIINANDEGDFRNKYVVSSLINFAKENDIDIDEEKMQSYFAKLPNSKKDTEAYVVKYKRRHPKEAAYNLIKNTEPTIEHIVPFSESGNNDVSNLLVMCSDCNGIRGNMSYDDFLAERPEMLNNIPKYFADIKKLLKKIQKELTPEQKEKYEHYIEDVKKTLEDYSPHNFNFSV